MQGILNVQPTLLGIAWPASTDSLLRKIILAVAGTALLTVSAKIQVPFYPVPMTMQTFAVLVIGMAFGWRLGAVTVLLYLAEGAFGLPVFAGTPAKGIGLAYMAGPTGGYLAGFLASAMAVGYLGERGWDRNFLTTLAAMILGTALIFGFGYVWLSHLIGMAKAFQFGVLPFLWGAAFKIALAALVLPFCWKFLTRKS
ncbi:MAG: biotin transporter BioY [Rhodospirillaceae bacterium]|nr:biotin transporter BioY [Rhodospirillaceae bacterium]MBT4587931.1 biotin transporter BioY [Rhodospirillaceae bacterium]MBT7265894.1 biotin transporter BioY [Rhodospirillaceae bacterium]